MVTVIVDMDAPESLGEPYPLDGVYSANSQVYVEFNEPIQTGRVLTDNVTVEGVLNAHQVDHAISLLLDNTTASTSATYNLGTSPFTLEMWVDYTEPGTLFSYANATNGGIEFGIDSTGHLAVKISGTTYTSANALIPDKWGYLIVQCDADTGLLSATYAYDDQTVPLFSEQAIGNATSSGNIRFGGNGLVAKMHEMSLWNYKRTAAEALSERSETKNPYTQNLLSLWHADEGKGFIVADNIRQRNLTLTDDSWAYNHTNYAMHVAAGDSAVVNLSLDPLVSTNNFVLEFWFRAAGDAVLCSLPNPGFKISVSGGNLVVGGFTLPVSGYQDDTWHHLALVKPKNAAPVVAIDGRQLSSPKLTTIPAFSAASVVFGDTANRNGIDIDEFRLWNVKTTLEAVKLLNYTCLTGSEAGLTAYYPMEAYVTDSVTSQTNTVFSLANKCTNAYGNFSITHSNPSNAQSSSAPALVESRPTEYVAHTYTTSNDKIVVNITESAQRIEGCNLEITVKDIVDVNGNYSDPIRWTVFVNRNQLLWDNDSYTVVKDEAEDTTIVLTIVNNSSVVQNWTIANIPSCISLSESSGTISPLQTKTITCTIDASASRGENEYTLTLSGNEDMESPLYITTKVYANRPDWNIDPTDFENSMNIIAYAEIDGWMTDDSEDMVAAFVDGELAGVTHLQLLPAMGRYYIMMTIFQNSSSQTGKRQVTFKYWDASAGMVYGNAQTFSTVNDTTFSPITITYKDNIVLGSIIRPIRLVMGEEIEQTIDLNCGWNWISYNVVPGSRLFDDILNPYLKKFSIIKSQMGYAVPDTVEARMRGNIGSMVCSLGYKIKAFRDFEMTLSGYAAPLSTTMNFAAGQWTWFGYLPQKAMTVNAALSDINANIGDIVKSQTEFATWDGYQWVGSLDVMVPGRSYVYANLGSSDIAYTYPDYAEDSWRLPDMRQTVSDYFEPVDPGMYQGNMNIMAVVRYDGEEVTTAEVGIFAGTECRAAATYDDGYYFLTVPGDSSVVLTVKVMYNDSLYILSETIQYQNDALLGTLTDPFVIELSPSTPGTSVEVTPADPTSGDKVEKVLIDNEVFIIRNGRRYDILGRPR